MVRCVGPCTLGSAFTTTSIPGAGIRFGKTGAGFRPGVYDGDIGSQELFAINFSVAIGGRGIRRRRRHAHGRRLVRIGSVPSGRVPEHPLPEAPGPAPAGHGSGLLRKPPLASPRAAHRAGTRAAGSRRAVSDGPAGPGRGTSLRVYSDASDSRRSARDSPARLVACLPPTRGPPAYS